MSDRHRPVRILEVIDEYRLHGITTKSASRFVTDITLIRLVASHCESSAIGTEVRSGSYWTRVGLRQPGSRPQSPLYKYFFDDPLSYDRVT